MSPELPGHATSPAEVLDVRSDGFTLHVDGGAIRVRFDDFPWFRDAREEEIRAVSRPSPTHQGLIH
jgi:hypothetical protein